MQTVDFETSRGVIPVTGQDFGGTEPAVLMITGAYAVRHYFETLPLLVPGFICHLPGNHSPRLDETSLEAFAEAFDEVVDQLARPVVVLGVSTGALVALAMRRPRFVVAVEPFLSTAKLWPLLPVLRQNLEDRPSEAGFLGRFFGVHHQGVADRDYRPLLEALAVPAEAVVGDVPLFPQRELDQFPSLVDETDRAALASHPLVTLTVAPNAGHDVPWHARRFLLARLQARLREAAGPVRSCA